MKSNKLRNRVSGSAVILSIAAVCFLFTGCHKHNYQPATCETASTCAECGETEGAPLGHIWSEATCTDSITCARCGKTAGSPLGHNWKAATCTEARTCTTCGATEGIALGHNYSKGSCTEDRVCKNCGETIAASGHSWVDATCLEAKTCSVCGETQGEALGHDYVNYKCTRCNEELGSLAAIQAVCGLQALCEQEYKYCVIDIDNDHNPYDVAYDYGEDYKKLVAACDWSLVFDADYYMKEYPMLAKLYHNDKALLLEHFQTVGVHEGRQGN